MTVPQDANGTGAPAADARRHLAQDLAAVFALELEEQLQAAARALPLLATAPAPIERCRELSRIFHTIKGGAGQVGRDDLAETAAALERFFADPLQAALPGQLAVDALFAAAAMAAPPVAGVAQALRAAPAIRAERVVLVEAAGQVLVLALPAIERAALLEAEAVSGDAVAWPAGETLPALHLSALLGSPTTAAPAVGLRLRGAVPAVLVVERIGPPAERVISPLPRLLAGHPLAGGVSLDQHGAPCLVLDAGRLLALRRPAVAPAPAAGDSEAVLVVDDSLVARRAVADALQAAGFAVETAADGCEALVKLAARRFAVVLTDLEMPHMDGLTLIAALRHDPRWSAQPVVVCSSRAPAEQADRLRALRVADYLAKPFNPEALVAAVRRLRDTPLEAPL